MDNGGDRGPTEDPIGDSTGDSDRGEQPGGTPVEARGASGFFSRIGNRTPTGSKDGTAQTPRFTAPPNIDDFNADDLFGKSKAVVTRRRRNKITTASCGSLVSLPFGAVSTLLTGNYTTLALDNAERNELGDALHEGIQDFAKENPFIRFLLAVAPWSRLIDGTAKAIWRRVMFVREHRIPKMPPPVPEPTFVQPNGEPLAYEDSPVIYAPDPSLANT